MYRAGTSTRPRWLVMMAIALFAALLASSCASDDESGDGGNGGNGGDASGEEIIDDGALNTGFVNTQDEVEPVEGGTLTMGMYSPITSLDPTVINGSGTAGGIEMAALYDVLMRYDYDTGEFVPHLAESLEPNEDFTQWTLTLPSDVTFTDGTPYDAEAVAFNLQRHNDSASRLRPLLVGLTWEVTDPQTLTFNLETAWSGFPWVLAWTGGYIASPTAIQADPENWADNPVGAGPFANLAEFSANEVLALDANEDYWGEGPYLDQIRFAHLQGDAAKAEAVLSDDFEAGFIRLPVPAREVIDAGYPGFLTLNNSGEFILMNNGVRDQTDRPTADERVRKAVRLAIDSQAYNDRGYDGLGFPTNSLMGPRSEWATESTVEADPEEARRLLEEYKAETGWDGKMSTITAVGSEDRAFSIQALLNNVGFDIEVEVLPTITDMINRVFIDANYDMISWGMNIADAEPWVALNQNLSSTSLANPSGFSDPQLDELLIELRASDDAARTQEILDEIQVIWSDNQPGVILSQQPELIAWNPSVHGVVPTIASMVLFHETFITG
ncbi:ABC transporter substrate-binding protein [Rhabdothermincola salaria]|uniref:ABC transporter substrate-binding protein n=1 Tax=Rhabdothermincola salaria TaxID=2903142 RepID=UPI001E35C9E5|nr:ABC transporter substrate-binding protein [Rhabdothermincola salaria]MCD9623261.1 ABC transporter substrate-binding protein [Rhabdothermincola salaria]